MKSEMRLRSVSFAEGCTAKSVRQSIFIATSCSNTTKQCQNEIIYDLQYQIELGLTKSIKNAKSLKMYQYLPKYVLDEGTHKIYKKNRRIFCEDCTTNELARCVCCPHGKEAKPLCWVSGASRRSPSAAKCHNHNHVKCTSCL